MNPTIHRDDAFDTFRESNHFLVPNSLDKQKFNLDGADHQEDAIHHQDSKRSDIFAGSYEENDLSTSPKAELF